MPVLNVLMQCNWGSNLYHHSLKEDAIPLSYPSTMSDTHIILIQNFHAEVCLFHFSWEMIIHTGYCMCDSVFIIYFFILTFNLYHFTGLANS